jgi:TolB-like protein
MIQNYSELDNTIELLKKSNDIDESDMYIGKILYFLLVEVNKDDLSKEHFDKCNECYEHNIFIDNRKKDTFNKYKLFKELYNTISTIHTLFQINTIVKIIVKINNYDDLDNCVIDYNKCVHDIINPSESFLNDTLNFNIHFTDITLNIIYFIKKEMIKDLSEIEFNKLLETIDLLVNNMKLKEIENNTQKGGVYQKNIHLVTKNIYLVTKIFQYIYTKMNSKNYSILPKYTETFEFVNEQLNTLHDDIIHELNKLKLLIIIAENTYLKKDSNENLDEDLDENSNKDLDEDSNEDLDEDTIHTLNKLKIIEIIEENTYLKKDLNNNLDKDLDTNSNKDLNEYKKQLLNDLKEEINQYKEQLFNNLKEEINQFKEQLLNNLKDKDNDNDELNTSFYTINVKDDVIIENMKKEINLLNTKMNQNIDFLTKLYNNNHNSIDLSIAKIKSETDLKLQNFQENIFLKIKKNHFV